MALPIRPNQSNFLGVALVINRSRDGPRLVFHYPPHIPPVQKRLDEDNGDDELGGGDVHIGGRPRPTLLEPMSAPLPTDSDILQWNQDDHLVTESGTQVVPWEHVAGFPSKDLESILSPPKAYHKTLFQISLDPLYCVSYPIHVPGGGTWKKKSKKERAKGKGQDANESLTANDIDAAVASQQGDEQRLTDTEMPEKNILARSAGVPIAEPAEEKEKDKDKASSMTMFNLVFILNPKKHDAKDLVDTMYAHIIRKVNKAYKYCQQRSDFVWKESKRILVLKDKGREDKRKMTALWNDILNTSSLAESMRDVYSAISQNKIAQLQLETNETTIAHSVQIPMPFHISDLPDEGDADARGMWLTTANSLVGDDALDEPSFLDKNFALLLLYDEGKIISDLSSDPDETTLGMIEFVKHCKPGLSFHQVGQQGSNVLTHSQVRKYAQHFIFWRRAIAIPPLHARDMYILSPNADMRRLPRSAAEWARAFPQVPYTLPEFLANLSAAPRPYKHFAPSKSHRPLYLQMLGWLMRGGWVTQLCTFAYIVVWPEILYEVDYALEAEKVSRSRAAEEATASASASARAGAGPRSRRSSGADGSDRPPSSASTPSMADSSSSSSSSTASTTTTTTRRSGANPPSPTTRPQPSQAERAAEKARLERIADKAAREAAEKATAHARKTPPRETPHPSINDAPHLGHLAPHIIMDAKKATGKESLYLDAIGRRLRDEKVVAAWARFYKYFNGRSALERIALQEDIKRKEAWNLLTAMSEYLLCVRHW